MRTFRSHFTPPMAVAMTALIVALAGTGYAAVTITGANIVNSSVTGIDVKDGSLTGRDIKDGTLAGRDILNGSIGKAKLASGVLTQGPVGPAGPAGPAGPTGAAGAPGSAVAYARVSGASGACAVSSSRNISATCFHVTDGIYEVHLTNGATLTDRVAVCSLISNSGFNATGISVCRTQIVDATTLYVETSTFTVAGGVGNHARESVGSIGVSVAVL